jgi:hypothetical protein
VTEVHARVEERAQREREVAAELRHTLGRGFYLLCHFSRFLSVGPPLSVLDQHALGRACTGPKLALESVWIGWAPLPGTRVGWRKVRADGEKASYGSSAHEVDAARGDLRGSLRWPEGAPEPTAARVRGAGAADADADADADHDHDHDADPDPALT